MKKSVIVKFAASALVLGTTAIGCKPAGDTHPATLSASTPKAAKGAAVQARRAEAALRAHKPAAAVAAAEAAAALQPQDAALRRLLGRTYLAAGRFASARTSFADAIALDPDSGQARVSLALSEAATGNDRAALTTLAEAEGRAAETDRGLALALAGDHDGAVRVLETAARTSGADAKTRQNLALAYALAGDWAKAQATAGQDLSPADTDARMVQWAKLAHPATPGGQVAALLGVTPAEDPGQPAALALAAPAAVAAETAAAEPTVAPAPVPVATAPLVASAAPVARVPVIALPTPAAPVFYAAPAARAVLPPLIRAPRVADRIGLRATPRIPALLAAPRRIAYTRATHQDGGWVIQLGAFSQRTTIESAWGKVSRRYAMLAGYTPSHSAFSVDRATFTRLTLGGFASRDAAASLCRRVRAAGGDCFVRAGAGEAPVQMVARKRPLQTAAQATRPVQIASR